MIRVDHLTEPGNYSVTLDASVYFAGAGSVSLVTEIDMTFHVVLADENYSLWVCVAKGCYFLALHV